MALMRPLLPPPAGLFDHNIQNDFEYARQNYWGLEALLILMMTRRLRVRVRMWTFVAMFSQGFFLYIAVQDLSDWTWGSMAWCWSSVRISRLQHYQHHPCQHHNHCHHHIHHWHHHHHTKVFTVIDSNLSIDLDEFPVLLVAVVLSGVATTFYTMRQVFSIWSCFQRANFGWPVWAKYEGTIWNVEFSKDFLCSALDTYLTRVWKFVNCCYP